MGQRPKGPLLGWKYRPEQDKAPINPKGKPVNSLVCLFFKDGETEEDTNSPELTQSYWEIL